MVLKYAGDGASIDLYETDTWRYADIIYKPADVAFGVYQCFFPKRLGPIQVGWPS